MSTHQISLKLSKKMEEKILMRVIVITVFLFIGAATAEDAAAEAYESPKLKKLITDCTGHVGETCSTTTSSSGSEALMQKQDGLALCLLDSMERCLLDHQTNVGTLGDLIILPPFPPRPPVDPNIIPFPRPPNIVPFIKRRRSKLDNHQTDAGTLGRVIPLPPIRPGPPLKIIPFPGTNIVPFPKPYIPHSYNTITNLLGARRDQVQDLPLLIQTTQLRTVLGICSHVTARTCLTAPNVATSDLEACLTPSMNQCVYPPGAESGSPPI
ncbi:nodulin-44 [Glycine soja]|nr:nodulin-44 [Glycine soja]